VTFGRGVVPAIASFVFPGLGDAVAGHKRGAIAWAIAVPVAMLLVFVSVWMFFVAFALRVASMISAGVVASRADKHEWFATLPLVIAGVSVVTFMGLRALAYEGFQSPSSSMYPTLQIGDHVFVDKLTPRWHAIERGEIVVVQNPCNAAVDYLKRVVALAGDTVEVRCNVLYVNGKPVPSTLVSATTTYQDFDEVAGTWITKTCSRYHEVLDGHAYDVFHDSERPARDARGAEGDVRDFPKLGLGIPPSCRDAEYGRPVSQPEGKLVVTKAGASACEPQLHYVVPEGSAFVLGDNRYNSNDSRYWGPAAIDKIRGRVFAIWLGGSPSGNDWSRIGAL
jgi:signal peptidase I